MMDCSYSGKRLVDLGVLAVVLVPASAVGLCCAIAIKLTSRGPVLFHQERVGHRGAPFDVVKFRTMVHAIDNPLFPDASRITGAGRWLRRLSLDELPQLVNVARSEMSIVGPRPTLSYQIARYDERQRQRLTVRPGVTGLAQVRGRNSIAWAERIELDLEYLEKQSPWFDIKVIFWTLSAVFRGSGVDGHPTADPIARPD